MHNNEARAVEADPAFIRAASGQRRVSAGFASAHQKPDSKSEIVTQLLHGEIIEVGDVVDGWVSFVAISDQYTGFLEACALAPDAVVGTHRVTQALVHCYSEPDPRSQVAVTLPLNAVITPGEHRSAKLPDAHTEMVQTRDGFWVPANCLSSVYSPAEDYVKIAEKFLNSAYLWGGRTAVGIDCSALIQVALNACGYACPRDTRPQRDYFTQNFYNPPSTDLKYGDILYIPDHVGFSIDDGKVLHADGVDMLVKVEDLEKFLGNRGYDTSDLVVCRLL